MTTINAAYRERAARDLTWQSAIVEHLCEYKANVTAARMRRREVKPRDLEREFSLAWSSATSEVQIPARDDGGYTLQLNINGDLTVAGFFRSSCQDAYEDLVGAVGSGLGPALRHFSVDMVDDDVRLDPVMAA